MKNCWCTRVVVGARGVGGYCHVALCLVYLISGCMLLNGACYWTTLHGTPIPISTTTETNNTGSFILYNDVYGKSVLHESGKSTVLMWLKDREMLATLIPDFDNFETMSFRTQIFGMLTVVFVNVTGWFFAFTIFTRCCNHTRAHPPSLHFYCGHGIPWLLGLAFILAMFLNVFLATAFPWNSGMDNTDPVGFEPDPRLELEWDRYGFWIFGSISTALTGYHAMFLFCLFRKYRS
jgi:hypothetical protein